MRTRSIRGTVCLVGALVLLGGCDRFKRTAAVDAGEEAAAVAQDASADSAVDAAADSGDAGVEAAATPIARPTVAKPVDEGPEPKECVSSRQAAARGMTAVAKRLAEICTAKGGKP